MKKTSHKRPQAREFLLNLSKLRKARKALDREIARVHRAHARQAEKQRLAAAKAREKAQAGKPTRRPQPGPPVLRQIERLFRRLVGKPARPVTLSKQRQPKRRTPTGYAREFTALDARGNLVVVEFGLTEAKRVGAFRNAANRGVFPVGRAKFKALDRKTYYLPSNEAEWRAYTQRLRDELGWSDISPKAPKRAGKFYKGPLAKAA